MIGRSHGWIRYYGIPFTHGSAETENNEFEDAKQTNDNDVGWSRDH